MLRAPTLRIYRQSRDVAQGLTNAGDGEPPAVTDDFTESAGFSSAVLAPFRAHVGVAREVGDGQLAAEVSYRAPLRNPDLFVDQTSIFNARVGGQIPLSDRVALGGGFFSDRSADRLTEDANGRDIDYYGLSFGVQLDTPYGVVSGDGSSLEPPRPLIFRSTLVLSYSVGIGQLQRLELGEDGSGEPAITASSEDVTVNRVVSRGSRRDVSMVAGHVPCIAGLTEPLRQPAVGCDTQRSRNDFQLPSVEFCRNAGTRSR